MKKKLALAGLLVGGITLTGVAGSAYAQDGTPAPKPVDSKGHAGIAIACVKPGAPKGTVGKDKLDKARMEKGTVSTKEPGRLPAPPAGAPRLTTRIGGKAVPAPGAKLKLMKAIKVAKDAHGVPKVGPLPKGIHCTVVKPGAPGAPGAPKTLPVPARPARPAG